MSMPFKFDRAARKNYLNASLLVVIVASIIVQYSTSFAVYAEAITGLCLLLAVVAIVAKYREDNVAKIVMNSEDLKTSAQMVPGPELDQNSKDPKRQEIFTFELVEHVTADRARYHQDPVLLRPLSSRNHRQTDAILNFHKLIVEDARINKVLASKIQIEQLPQIITPPSSSLDKNIATFWNDLIPDVQAENHPSTTLSVYVDLATRQVPTAH